MKCRLQEAAIDKSNSSDKYLNDYKKNLWRHLPCRFVRKILKENRGGNLGRPCFMGMTCLFNCYLTFNTELLSLFIR